MRNPSKYLRMENAMNKITVKDFIALYAPEDEEKLYATLIDVCYENMSYDRQVDFWRHVLETNSLVCEVKE